MFDKIIINLVISFVLRQIAKFQKTVDFAKIKADLEPRIRAVVPGTWLDDEAVAALNCVLDALSCLLGNTPLFDDVLHLLAAEKWSEAGDKLIAFVKDLWASQGGCTVPRAEKLLLAA